MVHEMVRPGDSFIASYSNNANLKVHASRGRNGSLSIMLINRDPDHAIDADLDLSGLKVNEKGIQFTYGPGHDKLLKGKFMVAKEGLHYEVAPYSIAVLKFAASQISAK